ncbi:ribonuclease HII [Spirulina sp. 06S082]|uniref:ribonuclease HII n=1 Tax=Spirulina sp. 06S082 TaxID=3110248 RepID=UPI002B210C7F|nr:ribonuclease HII [Spirulina sp. 06S082]MEA5468985.1 ribonuclease HII [Spirulina sp. 06S082]
MKSYPVPNFEYSYVSDNAHAEMPIAGVDEVGRGALFGPVVAAVVCLPLSQCQQLQALGVCDSKQLSAKKRRELALMIPAIATDVRIGYATVKEIDRLNILQASLLAMKRAILKLDLTPELCLIDGKFPIPHLEISQQTIIGGDRQSSAIAAASIIAKVWRDELIARFAQKYSHYDLAANKGYGTKRHRQGIEKYGISPQHRSSFKLRNRE